MQPREPLTHFASSLREYEAVLCRAQSAQWLNPLARTATLLSQKLSESQRAVEVGQRSPEGGHYRAANCKGRGIKGGVYSFRGSGRVFYIPVDFMKSAPSV